MNKGRHTSYQYRIGNRKGGSDTVGSRPWLGYMMPLQCLSYKGAKGGGQRNKIYSGRFPYLQGCLAPQAGYTITAAAGPLRTSRQAVVKVLSFWAGIVVERGGLEFPGVYSVLIISGTKGFRLRQFRLSFLSCSRGRLLWCAGLGH